MKIEPYVLLKRENRSAALVPVKDLKLSFSRLYDGSLKWEADAKFDIGYTPDSFYSYSGEQIKVSEIKAYSLEEFWLKLETAGFVYGGEDES